MGGVASVCVAVVAVVSATIAYINSRPKKRARPPEKRRNVPAIRMRVPELSSGHDTGPETEPHSEPETEAETEPESTCVIAPDFQSETESEDWVDVPQGYFLQKYMPHGEAFEKYYNVAFLGGQGTGKTSLFNMLRVVLAQVKTAKEVSKAIQNNTAIRYVEEGNLLHRAWSVLGEWVRNGTADPPMSENDNRLPTPRKVSPTVMAWDLRGDTGEDTRKHLEGNCIKDMSCVILTVGLQDTHLTLKMVRALHDLQMPFIMVQTKTDDHIFNIWRTHSDFPDSVEWNDAYIDDLLRKRRQYLRDTYGLEERDKVFCVNTQPFMGSSDASADIRRDTYELLDAILHILQTSISAHE